MRRARRATLLALLLLAAGPATGHPQVFRASRPYPEFAIGPLFVVTQVRPDPGPRVVTPSWSLAMPAGLQAADIRQDLFVELDGERVTAVQSRVRRQRVSG